MVSINVKDTIRSFSVVRHNFPSIITMSGVSKGGKAAGARPRTVTTLGSEGRENEIVYPTMDTVMRGIRV